MGKRKDTTADEILKMMYPDLPTSEEPSEQRQQNGSGTDNGGEKISQLEQQIARLQGMIESTNRSSGLPIKTNSIQAPVKPVVDYKKAPDPIQKPEEYLAFVNQATQAQIEYEKQLWAYQQQSANTTATRNAKLWSDFAEEHSDYAKDEERIEIAATRVLQQMQSAGVDLDTYMYGSGSKDFMKEVTKTYDKLFGKPTGDNGGADEDEDEDDDQRTNILGGGVSTAGTSQGKGGQPQAPQKFGDLGLELATWQEKTGFHR